MLNVERTKAGADMGRIRVFMKDGTIHDVPLGARTTLKGDAVIDKFRSNASRALDRDEIERVVALIAKLEQLTDARELAEAITVTKSRI